MDTNDQYFDCLCRTCMNELVEASSYDGNTKPQQQWQSIFDRIEECGAFGIAELLTNAVPQIEVQPSDELPKRICSKCLQQLLTVYRFQQMCIQSEQQMRQQVSKKRSDLEIPMEGEIETTNAGLYALKTLQPSSTHQNLEHSSIQKSLLETTEQMIKPEAAEISDDDIDKLLEDCRDAEGNLSEFVKNEPIEDDEPSIEYSDDEPSIEYSDGESTTSAISEKGERLSIEFEEEQIYETNVKANRIIHGEDKIYECPCCPRRFNLKSSYYRHKQSHEDVECEICGKSIRKGRLKEHKRIHSDKKAHKCVFCEKSFIKISHLRYHSRKHTGEKPYKCKYCERSFSSSSHRLRHMRVHLGNNVHRCELCPLAFPAASELRAHFTTHQNEDPETRERNMKALKEAEAELEIKAKENVKAHRIKHDEDKPYECPYCPRRFNARQNMYAHKAIHEGVKREICDICGKSIAKKVLKSHKQIHSNEKSHKCDICKKPFTRMTALHCHMRKHSGEKPYKCKYCDLSFSKSSTRLRHMRLHLGDNVHRCELCPLAFPAAAELLAHLTTHKNEDSEIRQRNMKALKEAEAKLLLKCAKQYTEKVEAQRIKDYECPYCPRRFSTKRCMTQHKETHEKVNREACDICGKIMTKKFLKQHKLGHSNEKPHKCDFCEKRFALIGNLRTHMRKHTGEKPYNCQYCGRSFTYAGHRLKHMRLHLGNNVHRCELCPLAFPVASKLRVHLTTHKNEDPETRERNMKALKEAEAKLQLKVSTCNKETRQKRSDKIYI